MSLRTALASLPDDRATAHAVHEVLACLVSHTDEPMTAARVGRATCLDVERVEPIFDALARASVIDCDGNPSRDSCVFHPDTVLALEMERYLRTGTSNSVKLQSSLGKYRSRLGRG